MKIGATMTPEAKSALSGTVRGLRTRLLADLHDATEAAYRLSVRARDAGLGEAARARRVRLDDWLDEQVRAESTEGRRGRAREHFRREVEKRAAYTLLNRLVLLRLLEGMGLRQVPVLTGGWESEGYRSFREIARALVRDDPSEGYAYLLQLIFEDLALELPGLYGPADLADLIPVGAATLRHCVEALDAPALATCWGDDMTLGWVYQYWNDPEREALDAKLHAGGKVEPHEIASKTQMFTERYMVDWLLQNSLGPLWLAMCRKHGWTADCERPLGFSFPCSSVGMQSAPLQRRGIEPDAGASAPAPTPERGSQSAVGRMPEGRSAKAPPAVAAEAAMAEPPEGVPPYDAPAVDPGPRLTGLLRVLDERRADWRARRERGEVALTDLMPLDTDAERRWAYYVPQPIPADAIEKAPDSVRDLKVLDPAVGSGHFLVVAFDLLFALYREEARHRGESGQERWSDRAICERILSHNLHGIDLDPRAVQIAAAALWLKARRTCPEARPARLNLVASNLRLAGLPETDPALLALRREVERETGIPAALTDTLIHALAGADHLGSLLKIDAAVEEAIERHEEAVNRRAPEQLDLFASAPADRDAPSPLVGEGWGGGNRARTKADILERLEGFLAHHTGGEDLGLRLHGEQLAAGVRFVRMLREGRYHLVVGNPPYQGTSKMADAGYVKRHYLLGKADLYAAFLIRGLQLAREGGTSALLTMRNWMFIKQYAELRGWLLESFDLRALGDFAIGAFDEVPNDVLSVVVSVFRNATPAPEQSVALQPTPLDDRSYDRERTRRKRAAALCHRGYCMFALTCLKVVPERPVVYWWPLEFINAYNNAKPLCDLAALAKGLTTCDDLRFLRRPWEGSQTRIWLDHSFVDYPMESARWVPFVNGATGRRWFEEVTWILNWKWSGIEIATAPINRFGRGATFYFQQGVAFSQVGHSFSARVHRFASIIGNKGTSAFASEPEALMLQMNRSEAVFAIQSMNPGIGFEIGDVQRIPLFPVYDPAVVLLRLDAAFSEHESHREPSVEFTSPGPSPWRHAQAWAQTAVDRSEGAPLPPYEPEYDPEPPTDHLSFALGVALGRFGGEEGILDTATANPITTTITTTTTNTGGEGILDPTTADLSHALPAGILFLDGTLDANERHDGLGHPAAEPLHAAWAGYGPAVDPKSDLRTWLRLKCFKDVHRGMYENRPIHWPLSSEKRTFVAWVTIHRWDAQTLRVLLADHLTEARKRIEGALADLRAARDGADRRAADAAERRYDRVLRWRDELTAFIAAVEQCAERGPPPVDSKCPAREQDARYAPDLDDGVMINSAALWPLLEPQWKDPRKWWQELASASGKKDYDWSHLAMRYWPTRVDAKCRQDPSLGVAHGCFWAYHPARAWAWELRLQDEIGANFRIEEAPYRGDGGHAAHRAVYLAEAPEEALATVAKEALRRRRKRKAPQSELHLLEPGLWTDHPGRCWDLELEVITRQGTDFHLRAPDEPKARADFEQANPSLVAERAALLLRLTPPDDLLTAAEEDGEPGAAADEMDPEDLDAETSESLEDA